MNKNYPELKNSEPVKLSHGFSLEKEAGPIDNWLKSVENFHKRHRDNPEKMRLIREAFYGEYVIRPENIPESYFEHQRLLARERGEGNVEITPENRKRLAETIIKDQQSSLNNWVSYLTSLEADKFTPSEINDDLLKITKGRWVKYKQGSDPKKLAESLSGHFTGWCIASESTAESYLSHSSFWIYQSNDKNGKPSIPRAGILEKKLKEFPDKEKFTKKTANMKLLTRIDNKQKRGEELTKDELRFIYEIDNKIEGFGLNDASDPRIEEIKRIRNPRQDFALMFNCNENQVALNRRELNEKTIVLADLDVDYIISHFEELSTSPDSDVFKKLDIDNADLNVKIEKLIVDFTHIGKTLFVKNSHLKNHPTILGINEGKNKEKIS